MTTALDVQRFTLDAHFTLLEVSDDTDESGETGGGWEFTALGIPYGEELHRRDWVTGAGRQVFEAGSVTVADNNQVHFGHDWETNGLPIGRITAWEQTDAGVQITCRISQTPKGAEVRQLMLDGVLTKVSAGLYTTAWRLEDDGDLLVHTESTAFEFSVVPQPAFDTASITSVNTKESTAMTAATLEAVSSSVTELTATVTDLARRVETIPGELSTFGPTEPPFNSYGAFIKAFAARDPEAQAFAQFMRLALREQDADTQAAITTLAYTGGTTADLGDWLKDSWIGDTLRVVSANRKLHNFFASSPLPATGNHVEFGVPGIDTTQVSEQATEGEVLAKGKITFDTDSAPVKTYGGWGEMTVQQIDRSPLNVVEKFFAAVLRRYAQVTEAALKTALVAEPGHVLAGTGTHDLATVAGWNAYLIDAAIYLEDTYGLAPEGILLDWALFKVLVGLKEPNENNYFLDRNNGTVSLSTLGGDVHTIRLIPFSAGDSAFVRIAHSEAIRTLESGNPTQLTDGDITNLSQAFSVYGYEAIAVEEPGLLVAPDATA